MVHRGEEPLDETIGARGALVITQAKMEPHSAGDIWTQGSLPCLSFPHLSSSDIHARLGSPESRTELKSVMVQADPEASDLEDCVVRMLCLYGDWGWLDTGTTVRSASDRLSPSSLPS